MNKKRRADHRFRRGTRYPAAAAALLLLSLLVCVFPNSVRAGAEGTENRTGSLTITAEYEKKAEEGRDPVMAPVSGMRVRLYRTADLQESRGGYIYKPVGIFTSVSVSYQDMKASDSLRAARKLADAVAGSKPLAEGVTGSDGKVSFENLKAGMYLAVQVTEKDGPRMDPCLWQVPMPDQSAGKNGWNYRVEVNPKTEITVPEKPQPPARPSNPAKPTPHAGTAARQRNHGGIFHTGLVRTSDLTRILPYAVSAAAALAALLLALARRRKTQNEQ